MVSFSQDAKCNINPIYYKKLPVMLELVSINSSVHQLTCSGNWWIK